MFFRPAIHFDSYDIQGRLILPIAHIDIEKKLRIALNLSALSFDTCTY